MSEPAREGQKSREWISYEEFLRTSPYKRAEWVDGKVVPLHSPNRSHQRLVGFLFNLFTHYVEAHEAGEVLFDFQMKTGADLPGRQPDIQYLSPQRMKILKKQHSAGPSDLVVEVISPDSRTRDRREKFAEYEEGGVGEYWVIDPEREEAWFYARSEQGRFEEIASGGEGRFESRVLPGFRLDLQWLWAPPKVMDVLRQWKLVEE